ncbi:hypothetical protein LTR66_015208, partial [Elasticomyces elasticus]
MDSTHLNPYSAATVGTKIKAVQDAKDMQALAAELANRVGLPVPDYEFIELIGKGSYGRVYKCKRRRDQKLVAVKVLDIDSEGATQPNNTRDTAIDDARKEVSTMRRLQQAGARNINIIEDAFVLHSQLWIITEYCPGGSLHTLMKAMPDRGLDEQYIIPIARELAVALKYTHDAGIIHRDIKCANILITEDGNLQLCDFGIAAVIENEVSKRSTIIGTPYWMPPEMLSSKNTAEVAQGYGAEVDCWAFGCTVYEMATGLPPNTKFAPEYLSQVLKSAPRLEGGNYSTALRDFVAFLLEERPQDRPNAETILRHPYIANTSRKYPTSICRDLLDRYMQWEQRGGQRTSLFNPMGAAALPRPDARPDDDDWNFSTTESFEKDYIKRYSALDMALRSMNFGDTELTSRRDEDVESTPKLTKYEMALEEAKIKRGERSMERLFNHDAAPYDLSTPIEDDHSVSDLPLRNMSDDGAANRTTMIDLDEIVSEVPKFNFDFGNVPTIKAPRPRQYDDMDDGDDNYVYDQDQAKRATREWKFPSLTLPPDNPNRRTQDWTFPKMVVTDDEPPAPANDQGFSLPPPGPSLAPAFRPSLTHTVTELVTNRDIEEYRHPERARQPTLTEPSTRGSVTSMIDLDIEVDPVTPSNIRRPSIANSIASHSGSMRTDSTSGNPFDLEEEEMEPAVDPNRFSFHRQYRSEPSKMVPHKHDDNALREHARDSSDSSIGSDREPAHRKSVSDLGDQAAQFWAGEYHRQTSQHTRQRLITTSYSSDDLRGNWQRFEPGFSAHNERATSHRRRAQRGAAAAAATATTTTANGALNVDDPDFPLSRLHGVLRSNNGFASRTPSRVRQA